MNNKMRNFVIFILGLLVGLNWFKIKKYSEPYQQKIQKNTKDSWHKLGAWIVGQKTRIKVEPQRSSLQAETETKPTDVEKPTAEIKESLYAKATGDKEKKEGLKEPITIEKIMKAREEKEEDKGKVKVTLKEESK